MNQQTDLFYNTTHQTGIELQRRIEKAANQNDAVLGLFQRFGTLTPSECLAKFTTVLRLTPPPITSIRRAITVLTKGGKLVKLDSKKPGMYGDGEHQWKFNG